MSFAVYPIDHALRARRQAHPPLPPLSTWRGTAIALTTRPRDRTDRGDPTPVHSSHSVLEFVCGPGYGQSDWIPSY